MFTATDDDAHPRRSAPGEMSIVLGLNTPPTITGRPRVSVELNLAYVFARGDFNYVDTDPATAELVSLTIEALPETLGGMPEALGYMHLREAGDPAVPGQDTCPAAPTCVTVGQDISGEAIAADRLVFVPGAGLSGNSTLTFSVSDGSRSSAAATMIVIIGNNPAPMVTDSEITLEEDLHHGFAASEFGYSDEGGRAFFDRALIVSLPTRGELHLLERAGGDIPEPGTCPGTTTCVTVGDEIGSSAMGRSTTSDRFVFIAAAGDTEFGNPYATFMFRGIDSGDRTSLGGPATMSINITRNDPPQIPVMPTVSVDLDETYVFTPADFPYADAEFDADRDGGAEEPSVVTLTSIPGAGLLHLLPRADATPDTETMVEAADLPLDLTLRNLRDGLLVFVPGAGESGTNYATFTFTVSDDDGRVSEPATMTVNVDNNAAPMVSSPPMVTTAVGERYLFQIADFNYADDMTPVLDSVTVTTRPGGGILEHNGDQLRRTDDFPREVPAADILAQRLIYEPDSRRPVSPVTFDFTVSDGSRSSAAAVMTIRVDTNPPPEITRDPAVDAERRTAYVFQADDFNYRDRSALRVTSTTPVAVVITGLPADAGANLRGALRLLGAAGDDPFSAPVVALNDRISGADIEAGLLVFTPDGDEFGAPYASFTFIAEDGGNDPGDGGPAFLPRASPPAVMTISVGDNFAPVVSDASVSLGENDDQLVFQVGDFDYTDAEDDLTPTSRVRNRTAFIIRTLPDPAAGVLHLTTSRNPDPVTETEVTAEDAVGYADVNRGRLVFVPASGVTAIGTLGSFEYTVRDSDRRTGNDATMTITRVATGAPEVTGEPFVDVMQGVTYAFVLDDFNYSSADSIPLASITIVSSSLRGRLLSGATDISGGGAVPRNRFTNDNASDDLTFVPTPGVALGAAAYGTFEFTVLDNTGKSSAQATMTLNAVAAPAAAPSVISAGAEDGELDEGGTENVTVRLDRAVPEGNSVTVSYRVEGAGATPAEAGDVDGGFPSDPLTITIAAGDTAGVIPVTAAEDTIVEGGETLQVTVTAAEYSSDGTPVPLAVSGLSPVRLTINDNDLARAEVRVFPSNASESNDTPILASVRLSNILAVDSTYTLALMELDQEGFGRADVDGTLPDDAELRGIVTVSVPAGDRASSRSQDMQVPITLVEDGPEVTEVFSVVISEFTTPGRDLADRVIPLIPADVRIVSDSQVPTTLTLNVDPAEVNEGAEFTATVRLNNPVDLGTATVSYVVEGSGTAEFTAEDADFDAVSGTVEIANLQREAMFTVMAVNDALVEVRERAIIRVTGVDFSDDLYPDLDLGDEISARIDINDTDAMTVMFMDNGITVGEAEAERNRSFVVALGAAAGVTLEQGLSVALSLADAPGGAPNASLGTENRDVSLGSELLTFPAGAGNGDTQTGTLEVRDDRTVEGPEDIRLVLSPRDRPAAVNEEDSVGVEIADDDSAMASLDIRGVRREGQALTVDVDLDFRLAVGATFTLELSSTTDATFGADPGNLVSTVDVIMPAGQRRAAATGILIIDDVDSEDDETFQVTVASAVYAARSADITPLVMLGEEEVTIPENDRPLPPPGAVAGVSLARSVDEGGEIMITVALDNPVEFGTASVDYTVAGDLAHGNAAEDADVSSVSGTVTIPNDSSFGTFTLTAEDDQLLEFTEGALVTVTNVTFTDTATTYAPGVGGGTNANFTCRANCTGTFEIEDTDEITVQFTATDAGSAAEGASAAIAVETSGDVTLAEDLVLSLTLQEGLDDNLPDASAADVSGRPLSLTLLASGGMNPGGSTSVAFATDGVVEGSEDLQIALREPSGETRGIVIGGIDAIGLQIDDGDTAQAFVTVNPNVAEGDNVTFRVNLTAPLAAEAVVTLALGNTAADTDNDADVDGTAPDDATLGDSRVRIPAGQMERAGSAAISIVRDDAPEPAETFQVEVDSIETADRPGLSVTPGTPALVTIAPSTVPVRAARMVDINLAAAEGGDSGSVRLLLENPPTTGTATVTFSLAGSTATRQEGEDAVAGDDYRLSVTPSGDTLMFSGDRDTGTGTFTIPAGEDRAVFRVVPVDDDAAEGQVPETVSIDVTDITFAVGGMAIDSVTGSPRVITIADNDVSPITVSFSTASPIMGTEGDANPTFTVRLTARGGATLERPLVVGLDLAPAPETPGVPNADTRDVMVGTLTFPAGEGNGDTQTGVLMITNDEIVEGTEDTLLQLLLQNPPSGVAAGDPVRVEIADDDSAAASLDIQGVREEGQSLTVEVSLDSRLAVGATFTLELSSTDDATFGANPGNLVSTVDVIMPAGADSVVVPGGILIINDVMPEDAETFQVSITGVVTPVRSDVASLVTIPALVEVTIPANDRPLPPPDGVAAVVLDANSVDEGGAVTITVVLNNPVENAPVTVAYTVAGTGDNPAEIPDDVAAGGTFSIQHGTVQNPVRSGTFTLTAEDDLLLEFTEGALVTVTTVTFTSTDAYVNLDVPPASFDCSANCTGAFEIMDTDALTVQLAPMNGTAAEGDSVDVMVTTSGAALEEDLDLSFSVAAAAGGLPDASAADVSGLPLSLTLSATDGMNPGGSFTVEFVADDLVEGSEELRVVPNRLPADTRNVAVDAAASTLEIMDGDMTTASLAVSPVDVDEGDMVTATVSLPGTPALVADAVFTLELQGTGANPATVGTDVTPSPATVTIRPGSTSAEASFEIVSDLSVEDAETFQVRIISVATPDRSGAASQVMLDPDPVEVTIAATPEPSALTGVTVDPLSVTEGGMFTVTATLDNPVAVGTATLSYVVEGSGPAGAAAEAADFVAVSGTVEIAILQREAMFTVTTRDDELMEGAERARIRVTDVDFSDGRYTDLTEAALNDAGNNTAGFSIDDNEAAAIESFAPASTNVREGLDGSVMLTVTLDGNAPRGGVTFPWAVSGEGVTVADYTLDATAPATLVRDAAVGTFTIPAGMTSGVITVSITDDPDPETVETLTLTLMDSTTNPDAPVPVTVGRQNAAVITITDNDIPMAMFTAPAAAAMEEGEVPAEATLTITDAPGGAAATVSFTLGGTATPGDDYTLAITHSSGTNVTLDLTGGVMTFTLPAGVGAAVFTVSPEDDALLEAGGETVIIDLTGITFTGGGQGIDSVTGSPLTIAITDNDTPMAAFVATVAAASEGAEALDDPGGPTMIVEGVATLTITDAPDGAAATVSFTLGGGANDATPGDDYTLAIGGVEVTPDIGRGTVDIPAAATEMPVVFTVTPLVDNLNDEDETVTITITGIVFDPAQQEQNLGLVGSVVITIADNNGDVPQVALLPPDPAAAAEEGRVQGVVPLQITDLPGQPGAPGASVQVDLTGSTANVRGNAQDYVLLVEYDRGGGRVRERVDTESFVFTLPPGTESARILVRPRDDDLHEGTEEVSIGLSRVSFGEQEADIVDSPRVITIADNDAAPMASLEDTDLAASETAPDTGAVTLRIANPPPGFRGTVSFTLGGTATLGDDYALAITAGGTNVTPDLAGGVRTFTLPTDADAAVFTVTPADDALIENGSQETVSIGVTGITYGSTIPAIDSVTGSPRVIAIADNDAATAVLEGTDLDAGETGSDPGTVTLTLTVPPGEATAVVFALGGSDSDATLGDDYALAITHSDGTDVTPPNLAGGARTFTLPADVDTAVFTVTPVPDGNQAEGAEIVRIAVTEASYDSGTAGVVLPGSPQDVTIADNTAPVAGASSVEAVLDRDFTFSAADFTYSDDHTTPFASLTITVPPARGRLTSSGANAGPGTVVSLADIQAGGLVFRPAAGESGEPYTTFRFTASDGHLPSAPATMTIDVVEPSVEASIEVAGEADVDEPGTARFRVTLVRVAVDDAIDVPFNVPTTMAGMDVATRGEDYVLQMGGAVLTDNVIRFAASQENATDTLDLVVAVMDDREIEQVEVVAVELMDPAPDDLLRLNPDADNAMIRIQDTDTEESLYRESETPRRTAEVKHLQDEVGRAQSAILMDLVGSRMTSRPEQSDLGDVPPASEPLALSSQPTSLKTLATALKSDINVRTDTGGQYGIWAKGALRSISGDTTMEDRAFHYEGDLWGAASGLEWVLEDSVVGFSVNYTSGELETRSGRRAGAGDDDEDDTTTGTYIENTYMLMPYFSTWPDANTHYWLTLGVGSGTAEDSRLIEFGPDDFRGQQKAQADIFLWLASGGGEYRVDGLGGTALDLDLGATGLAMSKSVSDLLYSDGVEVTGTDTTVLQLRGQATVGYPVELESGTRLRPFLGLATVHDLGDAPDGDRHALDLDFGLEMSQARWNALLEGSAELLREDKTSWGLSAAAQLRPGLGGRGMSLSLTGSHALTLVELVNAVEQAQSTPSRGSSEWRVGLEAGYGFSLGNLWLGGVLTPYLITQHGEDMAVYGSGLRLTDEGLNLDLELTRSVPDDDEAEVEDKANLRGNMDF